MCWSKLLLLVVPAVWLLGTSERRRSRLVVMENILFGKRRVSSSIVNTGLSAIKALVGTSRRSHRSG